MKIKLINVGRAKVNKIIEMPMVAVGNAANVVLAASDFLLSGCVDACFNNKTNRWDIFAGFHKVGEAEILESLEDAPFHLCPFCDVKHYGHHSACDKCHAKFKAKGTC